MRPVDRQSAPNIYTNYEDAKADLVSRIGGYCSYCERSIVSMLAVEHVLPKGLPQYALLEVDWTNFLLACVNCNSKKKDHDGDRALHLWPDDHNTLLAFDYDTHGRVTPMPGLSLMLEQQARNTIEICGLNLNHHVHWNDDVAKQAILERWGQRRNAWKKATDSLTDYQDCKTIQMARQVVRTAVEAGFFSIWMKVFNGEPDVKRLLISEFRGTNSHCFNANGDCIAHPTGRI